MTITVTGAAAVSASPLNALALGHVVDGMSIFGTITYLV